MLRKRIGLRNACETGQALIFPTCQTIANSGLNRKANLPHIPITSGVYQLC